MSTRLNDPKTGAKIIVMQRIHEKDLSGHVLEQGGYEHLFLPAEFEPARRCVTALNDSACASDGESVEPHCDRSAVGPEQSAMRTLPVPTWDADPCHPYLGRSASNRRRSALGSKDRKERNRGLQSPARPGDNAVNSSSGLAPGGGSVQEDGFGTSAERD